MDSTNNMDSTKNMEDAGNESDEQGDTSGQQASGGPEGQAGAGPEEENPLAHLDPDQVAAGPDGAKDKVLFNDPSADPLWNPSLEPDPAADPLSGRTDSGADSESGQEDTAGGDQRTAD
ncbi:hypothetical protein [Paenarthrobacter sp. Z7-10]|uniref:hypothetical protein n=1 Tax=Paenarthrobacter sp. Z7-10 TaxID=2787635 RepID=UPI0022A9CAE7|nr:hypothetical protein [Paenarthrobacter sp. Z7-10]